MKTRKSIYTLLIVAMCSCSGSTTPVKEQLEAVQTVQQTVEQLPEKEYKKLDDIYTRSEGKILYLSIEEIEMLKEIVNKYDPLNIALIVGNEGENHTF